MYLKNKQQIIAIAVNGVIYIYMQRMKYKLNCSRANWLTINQLKYHGDSKFEYFHDWLIYFELASAESPITSKVLDD